MNRVVFPNKLLPYLLVAPQILVTLVFFFWPAGVALYESTQLEPPFGDRSVFVGLDNFAAILADPAYRNSIGVTAIFVIGTAVTALVAGLLLAVMAERVITGRVFFRTLLIWPYAIAPAIAGILWLFMFSDQLGTFAYLLHDIGIAWDPLLNATHAMVLIIAAAAWKQVSYNFLFFVAGLQAIPKSLIEAAAIDGAGPAKRFWTIIFPLLGPTAFFLLAINTVYAFFDTFGIVDAVTAGGPGRATDTLVYKVYRDGYINLEPGISSAESVILMVIVIALTTLQFRTIERRVHYG